MRVTLFKAFLWLIAGAAAVVAFFRFLRGMGSSTALTDLTPWGFWIGFDVTGGVALAAGGFVIAATVYIFHLEKYHPIVRPAVLTAFLGYLAVVAALLLDLGLPWNIWHMIIYWNPHSPLFEVGWCVMLYTSVLALEFAPVVLEPFRHPLLQKLYSFLKKMVVPLVILGIMLSTLHQSSLGSLFLIMPHRLHFLWYTPLLPVFFFVSAVALALATVTLESLLSAYLYRKTPEWELLEGLGKAGGWVLLVYLALRLGELALSGEFGGLWSGGFSANLYLIETLLSTIIPAAILLVPAWRRRRGWLAAAAIMMVAGFVMNRLDVSGIAMVETTGTPYLPSWMEIVLSAGVVAGAALVYLFVAEHFHLFHAGPESREQFRYLPPEFSTRSMVWRPDPYSGSLATNSLMAVLGAALAIGLLPETAVAGRPTKPSPVTPAGYAPRMLLDGNRAGEAVAFSHQQHVEREGGEQSCRLCHHLQLPRQQASGCGRCHRDMYLKTNTFDHRLHEQRTEGECNLCHLNNDEPKTLEHGKPCLECHSGMVAEGTPFPPQNSPRLSPAPGYVDALHGVCIGCHRQRAERLAPEKARLGECATCHAVRQPVFDPTKPDDARPE